MYKIKRHKLLNLIYAHDQYSGPITDEYELLEEVNDYHVLHAKLDEYKKKFTPNIEGMFEYYYRHEHMKSIWGDDEGKEPFVGQLFFICVKEAHSQRRTLFKLCEVKSISEPQITFFNHAESKFDTMSFGAFQGLAMIPNRDENHILNWESRVKIRYPRRLVSKLIGATDCRQVGFKKVAITQYQTDWDIPDCRRMVNF